ncbi:bacterial regulatory helix-turn-helix, lysR family protein [Anoxybacillus sp. B7M1]|uniref:LysR family transcriptional regulator n=1 Tax=unclassified Anoxybacillus TaxID=2639704 RepID=UPI0007B5C29B|nr:MULTISPECIES: LysR family transcriptional regulator [unclassified Anoxybacillus]ANB58905.1 bacterial regulatory helix-turn-helix, lysR family protein [Anoxybacillus sp. B2M1]ANB64483.1 bacterial regulatory helix-turn-helix, lysR family protein [Anoxybacillus sp. B7M1]
MNINYLQTFREAAKWNSFTKAGEVLGYAQSSVTTQIKKLEEEFGVILFERWSGRIKLTPAGKELLEYANKMIHLLDEARQSLSEQAELAGSLSIGTIESIAGFYLPPYLQAFKNKYPRVNLLLQQGVCQYLVKGIKEGKYDLAIILDQKQEDPDLHFMIIKEEPLVLVAKPDHPFVQRDPIYMRDLENEKLIVTEQGCSYREMIENLYRRHAVRLELTIELGSIEAIKRCVAYGLGIAFLPLMAVKEEIANGKLMLLPLSNIKPKLYLQLVYHQKKWLSQSMKQLIHLLLEEKMP